ncbi:sugar ABC transporter ATP-binding protein [Leucobacter soli]
MDEPTAPLSRREVEQLHGVIRSLKAQGTSIVFVSHFLDEVLEITDTVTVMKDGQRVRTSATADETKDSLVLGMLGRSLDSVFPEKRVAHTGDTVLAVEGLSRQGVLKDVGFTVRAGEIVGLGGLVGSGRTETLRAVFGADAVDAGTIAVAGKPVTHRSPADAMKNGLALVPESRKSQGLLMGRSIHENIVLPALGRISPGGIIRSRRESQRIEEMIRELGIKLGRSTDPVSTLSGGNQQKVAIAKWLVDVPRLLMIDEPTRGVDIGAKASIYKVLRALADEGMAILLVSSELEELLGLSDRVYVMSRGRLVEEFTGDLESQEEAVLTAAFA